MTNSTEEYELALAEAARMSNKFGLSQSEVTAQLASLNGRLGQLGFGLKETVDVYEGFNVLPVNRLLLHKKQRVPCCSSHRLLVAAD